MKMLTTTTDRRTTRVVLIALAAWLAMAAAAGISGILHGASATVVTALTWGLTAATLATISLSRTLRRWSRTIDLRWLVLFHGIRFIGIAFLVLSAGGELPTNFAVSGGQSGIVIATLAIAVAYFAVPVRNVKQWWGVLAWNLLGLAGNLRVLAEGIHQGMNDMGQMAPLTEGPLSVVPLFLVPMVITTHLLIFARLWRQQSAVPTVSATI